MQKLDRARTQGMHMGDIAIRRANYMLYVELRRARSTGWLHSRRRRRLVVDRRLHDRVERLLHGLAVGVREDVPRYQL